VEITVASRRSGRGRFEDYAELSNHALHEWKTSMDDLKSPPRTARALAKRERIVGCAMRHFEDGYPGARVEDIATELAIAKGSIFQYFGSKAGLFLEVYKHAVASLPAWLDAPQGTLDEGFFATVAFWLERTEHLVKEDWIPYRVSLIGNYGTDLELKRKINRFLVSEDPYSWSGCPARCRSRWSPRSSTRGSSTGGSTSPTGSGCAWSISPSCCGARSVRTRLRRADA
jgi:AcrR family transcriptional regulator